MPEMYALMFQLDSNLRRKDRKAQASQLIVHTREGRMGLVKAMKDEGSGRNQKDRNNQKTETEKMRTKQ